VVARQVPRYLFGCTRCGAGGVDERAERGLDRVGRDVVPVVEVVLDVQEQHLVLVRVEPAAQLVEHWTKQRLGRAPVVLLGRARVADNPWVLPLRGGARGTAHLAPA